jgi:phosphatidylserine/phosphatidylglycerophosphate/cardiolipin synthase-like enzyme
MRKLIKNSDDTFRVKGYAGTNGVLLAFDLDESLKQDCLGFAIKHKEENKQWQWLLSSLTFPGLQHTLPQWNATPSNLAPIQKFRWADYSIKPGVVCKYAVYPVYGTAEQPQLGDGLEVELKTDDGKPVGQRVFFNRAVAASQAFGRKFPELDKEITENNKKSVEDWPDAPRNWLQNGLLDCILNFIGKAKDSSWALDVAIYEYELKAIVDAINKAHQNGIDVRVLYHSKKGDEQTSQNEASLKKIPKSKKRPRVTSAIFHDKFIVLSKINSAGDRIPKMVLCGSTNFTENGVYRQANVVHAIDDSVIAQKFADIFNFIWNDDDSAVANVTATRKWINKNNPIDPGSNFFVGFSPRTGKNDLAEFIDVINEAKADILFATAFKLPEDILDAILGKNNDPVVRYGIQNSASRITGYHADRSAEFVTPALLKTGLEGWIKEGLKGQRGNLLVHTKAIVVNFTSDDPVIISGSHNLSNPASMNNDEAFTIIRGDQDLADRYGIEILRFYEHYRFRYYAEKLKLMQVRPLEINDSWTKSYYKAGDLKQLARERFAGR